MTIESALYEFLIATYGSKVNVKRSSNLRDHYNMGPVMLSSLRDYILQRTGKQVEWSISEITKFDICALLFLENGFSE